MDINEEQKKNFMFNKNKRELKYLRYRKSTMILAVKWVEKLASKSKIAGLVL